MKGVRLARSGFALTAASRATYQKQVSGLYQDISRDAALLAAPGRRPGTIFTIENPIVYRLAGRAPAPAFRGVLFPTAMGAAEWAALTERLACAPPAFVLVERRYVPLVDGRRAAGGESRRLSRRRLSRGLHHESRRLVRARALRRDRATPASRGRCYTARPRIDRGG